MFYLIGLGNPGLEYENTRHNVGRMAIADLIKKEKGSKKIKIIESAEFMNNSGKPVAKLIKSKKAAQNLVVVHDDLDLPIGTLKISFNKSAGGHRGVASIIKAIKTQEFVRVRIGIAPSTPTGKLKKPTGEQKVLNFILDKFSPKETDLLKKVFKKSTEAIQTIVEEGKDRAMNIFN
jgi:PTH1 family peptidyl-tRNA hydrolase